MRQTQSRLEWTFSLVRELGVRGLSSSTMTDQEQDVVQDGYDRGETAAAMALVIVDARQAQADGASDLRLVAEGV